MVITRLVLEEARRTQFGLLSGDIRMQIPVAILPVHDQICLSRSDNKHSM